MDTHFEILIDASGSMGYMNGYKDEGQYLLPDGKSTRTDLVKTILLNDIIPNLSFVDTIGIRIFRNYLQKNENGEYKFKTIEVKNKEGEIVKQKVHQSIPLVEPVYKGLYNLELIESRINDIKNPEPAGTPIYYALTRAITKSEKNQVKIIIISDGDSNDRVNFDEEILIQINESKKDCTIHFIGISQGDVALKKSKNLAEQTGGIYINLKALNYDKNELNVLLSKLNTSIVGNALIENIKDTQALFASTTIETAEVERNIPGIESKEISDEQPEEEQPVSKYETLEKQIHKNTNSLEYISGQLNNILTLLQSKNALEDEDLVVENSEYNKRIGRLAEAYLFEKLYELFNNDSTEVIWLNQKIEQGLPYDFKIKKDKEIFYYECKGSSSDLNEFQLTKNEWCFYLENRGKYRLCFVRNIELNAGYVRFMDLLKDMESQLLVPCSPRIKTYKADRIVFTINNTQVEWI